MPYPFAAATGSGLPAPDSPWSIGWAAIVFFVFIAGLDSTLRVLRYFRPGKTPETLIGGQPISVKGADRFATIEEHVELKERVDDMSLKIDEGFRHLDQKRSVSIAGLHEQTRLQGEKIAALAAETAKQTADLIDLKNQTASINSRIDGIPSRTIALLKDTKKLL
jgi:hypothetical protein